MTEDHDLLIEINTKLERALTDIKDLKTDLANRVRDVETDLDGLGERVASLENWRWYVVGITTILALLAQYLMKKYL